MEKDKLWELVQEWNSQKGNFKIDEDGMLTLNSMQLTEKEIRESINQFTGTGILGEMGWPDEL